jgi:hypothetical protein
LGSYKVDRACMIKAIFAGLSPRPGERQPR